MMNVLLMKLGTRFLWLVDVAELEGESLGMKVQLDKVVGIAEVASMPRAEADCRGKLMSLLKMVVCPRTKVWLSEGLVDADGST